jgi:hypothetical protein
VIAGGKKPAATPAPGGPPQASPAQAPAVKGEVASKSTQAPTPHLKVAVTGCTRKAKMPDAWWGSRQRRHPNLRKRPGRASRSPVGHRLYAESRPSSSFQSDVLPTMVGPSNLSTGVRVMTEDFVCPRCTSRYKLVRVRAEPGSRSHLVHCRVCKEPFPSMGGEYALKYFLVDRARKRNGVDLRMKHPASRPATRPAVHQQ